MPHLSHSIYTMSGKIYAPNKSNTIPGDPNDTANKYGDITATDICENRRALDTLSRKFLIEVEKGNIEGHQLVKKFGASDAIGTNFTPVCSGNVYNTPSTITSLEIVSDSVNDAAGGTGARTVRMWGLSNTNGAWTEEVQDIALNGLTAVAIPNDQFRVYRLRVLTSGTYATSTAPSHNSTITLRESGAGATWAIINTEGGFGLGSSEIGVFSVPSGVTAYLLSVHFDVEGNKAIDVIGFKREGTNIITAPFSPMDAFLIKRGIEGEHKAGDGYALQTVTGPCDIGFMARIASGTAKVEVEFVLLCVEDGF